VHDLTPAADHWHGDQQAVYGGTGYHGITKKPEMELAKAEFSVAMWAAKR